MPHGLRGTYLMWRLGIDPRYTVARETYQRHRLNYPRPAPAKTLALRTAGRFLRRISSRRSRIFCPFPGAKKPAPADKMRW